MKKIVIFLLVIFSFTSFLISGEIGKFKKGTKLTIVKESIEVIKEFKNYSGNLNLETESSDSPFGYNWRVFFSFKDKKLDEIRYTTSQKDIPELLDRFRVCLLNFTKILGEPDEVNEDYSQYYLPYNVSNRVNEILKVFKKTKMTIIGIKVSWLGKKPVELSVYLHRNIEMDENLFFLSIPGKISFDNNVEILTKNNIEKHSELVIKDEETKEEPQFEHDFRNANWGMSKFEIKEIENSTLKEDSDYGLIYSGSVGIHEASIFYRFTNGKLSTGAYFFDAKHTNKNKCIDDYDSINRILKNKYGTPISEETTWLNDLYKDDYSEWGFAVSLGHLKYVTVWELGETDIIHSLDGDNYSINHSIVYFDANNQELNEEHEKQQSDGF